MVCVCSPGGGALVVGYSVSPPPSFLTLDPLYSTIFYWWHSTALGARTSAYLAYLARTCASDPAPYLAFLFLCFFFIFIFFL